MYNSSYNSRRIVTANQGLKIDKTAPTGSNLLLSQYRFEYDFSTNSFTSTTAPTTSTSIFVDSNVSLIKINYSSYDIFNSSNGYLINDNLYYGNNFTSPYPSYLDNYKEVTLSSTDKYAFLSNISSGSFYILKKDYDDYGGRFSYYDKELDTQLYSSFIQNKHLENDGLYYRIDFNLLDFEGSDLMLFSKYLFLDTWVDGETDDMSYSIWVPNDTYVSLTKPTPIGDYGNNFDYDYMDGTGNVVHDTVTSYSYGESLFPYFSNFSNNLSDSSCFFTAISLICRPHFVRKQSTTTAPLKSIIIASKSFAS